MKCKLCEKEIENYSQEFNQLVIDNSKVNICSNCLTKIAKWQTKNFAKFFPTKAMKRLQRK
ncbi:MAG: hypothetical protein JW700_00070 [Candidatus Aenigmarchaeota archaeon]|nr:hypothetical protein [Candidatus Aenigmarchaeota archaeon]